MLGLNSTSMKVRITTGSAGDIETSWSGVDKTGSGPASYSFASVPTSVPANISTATTGDLVPVPGSSTERNVKKISVANNHATDSNLITIDVYDGTNSALEWKGTLLAGEHVKMDEAGRWTLYDVNGSPKLPSAKLDAKLYVVSNVVNATTSFADVTGLTIPLKSGKKYNFEAHLVHVNNASTTGSQFGVNIGGSPTLVVATIDTVTPSVTASAHSAGVVTAVDTAATAQTTGSTSNRLAIVSGYVTPSADGTFAIRCKSEVAVAAGLTVLAGSWLRIWEADNS